MVEYLQKLEEQACAWPGVSAQPHQRTGRVFRLGRSEVGRVNDNGGVEIPLPSSFRDVLLAEGLAEKHCSRHNAGGVTFQMRSHEDVNHAAWLLRLAYLRFVLKAVPDPIARFEQESQRLRLSSKLRAALEQFVPQRERQVA